MTKTHYISGPMTGLPQFNYPFFAEVATFLRGKDLKVVSPHEIDGGQQVINGEAESKGWEYYMRKALLLQLESDAWVGLPGWTQSKGAKREFDIAVDLQHELYLLRKTSSAVWLEFGSKFHLERIQ